LAADPTAAACWDEEVLDAATIASLATAGGTLVLAAVTLVAAGRHWQPDRADPR